MILALLCRFNQFLRCLIFKNLNIFHLLKLEIVLAIPTSNYWETETNDPAGQEWYSVARRGVGFCLCGIFMDEHSQSQHLPLG